MATQSHDGWSTLAAAQALASHAPTAEVALNQLIAATAAIPQFSGWAATAREVCARTLALTPLPGAAAGLAVDPEAGRIVSAFAEQFSLDVSAMDAALRAQFIAATGTAAFTVAQAIYVADMAPRLRRVLEQLFPVPAAWPQTPATGCSIDTAFGEFVRVVYNMRGLDPITTELVRLRGARQHQCRLCKSLRAQSALAAGASEALFDAVDRYADSDLPAAQKAALALTDAMIWEPAHIAGHIIADVRRHFTPAQAVELVLDVMRNAANKAIVSIDADAPSFEGVQVYDIDSAGQMHVGAASL